MRTQKVLYVILTMLLLSACAPQTRTAVRPTSEYQDRWLCFAVTVPEDWTYIDGMPSAFASFGPRDRPSFTIANNSFEETPTLERALENLKQGSLGPSIQSVENWAVDSESALWVTLVPDAEFKFVVLVITQCGNGRRTLSISATDANRESFVSFLNRIRFIR